ncbi:hypothetical protein F5148DRAFT_702444 [Russula earlei]|uniref:Uncharacterized protein n=1 Tax=Russula earlei TaxID=71964 RepID=A0ACC0UDH7_9AGAM|nr:hypothetical protein F5148DRAFT_702444 [Russula earlei]
MLFLGLMSVPSQFVCLRLFKVRPPLVILYLICLTPSFMSPSYPLTPSAVKCRAGGASHLTSQKRNKPLGRPIPGPKG